MLLFAVPAFADLGFIHFIRFSFIRRCERHKNRLVLWVPMCFKLQQNSNNHPTDIELLQDAKHLCFPQGERPVRSKQLCNSIVEVDYYLFIAVYEL